MATSKWLVEHGDKKFGSTQMQLFQADKVPNLIWQTGQVWCEVEVKIFQISQSSNGRRKGLNVTHFQMQNFQAWKVPNLIWQTGQVFSEAEVKMFQVSQCTNGRRE